jgi:hypothetical protein
MIRPGPFTESDEDYDGGLFYPSSEGSDLDPGPDAALEARRLIQDALADYFSLDDDVFVGRGIRVRGPAGSRMPDAFVARRVKSGERSVWSIVRERVAPAVCIDVLRAGRLLLGPVKADYERWGVKEFLLVDPGGRQFPGRVGGFRLRAGRYTSIRPGGDGGIHSVELGLRLVSEYGYPRFVEPASNRVVLTRREQAMRSLRSIHPEG